MRLLLDTNAFLWWCGNDSRLGERAKQTIKTAITFVSAVSAWEMAIKSRIGKLEMMENVEDTIEREGFNGLPLTFDHVREFDCLPPTHTDPFDRMIAAQAKSENLMLLSSDKILKKHIGFIIDARK